MPINWRSKSGMVGLIDLLVSLVLMSMLSVLIPAIAEGVNADYSHGQANSRMFAAALGITQDIGTAVGQSHQSNISTTSNSLTASWDSLSGNTSYKAVFNLSGQNIIETLSTTTGNSTNQSTSTRTIFVAGQLASAAFQTDSNTGMSTITVTTKSGGQTNEQTFSFAAIPK